MGSEVERFRGSEAQRFKGLMRLIVDQRISRLINQSINCGSEVQRLKGSEVERINEINCGSEDQSVDQSIDQLWIRGTVINPIDQC